jgi:DNA-directed RNA polymerase subunit RPC12/RpoP
MASSGRISSVEITETVPRRQDEAQSMGLLTRLTAQFATDGAESGEHRYQCAQCGTAFASEVSERRAVRCPDCCAHSILSLS